VRLKCIVAAAVGVAGALGLAGPASATVPTSPTATLTGTASCSPGAWAVSWKLTTAGTHGADATLTKLVLTYDPPPVPWGVDPPPPAVGMFTENAKISGDGTFTAYQTVGVGHPSAELGFTLTWTGGMGTWTKGVHVVVAQQHGCPTPTPTYLPAPTDPPPTPQPTETIAGPAPTLTPPAKPVPTPTEEATTAGPSPSAQPSASTGAPPVLAAGTGSGASGGGLPRTGAAVVSVAGLAAVLIAAGLSLFLAARRRRARFTA
jgi:LPXTG-motif cell wall-anchored protein